MKKDSKAIRLTLYAVSIALILLLTFVPIQTLGLEISLAMIPIAVGGIALGPSGGAVLGGIYGVFSYLQCFGLIKASAFGMAMAAINPLYMGITCIVPRFLCGWLAALVFASLSQKSDMIGRLAACLCCPILNTVGFMGSLMLFFSQSDVIQGYMNTLGVYNPVLFVLAFVGINGAVEIAACGVIGTAVSKALASVKHF